jgi:hypothetical protein
MAPHRHLVVDVTVTSARANTNVPRIGARLPLPGSLALGAQNSKLDADLRTSSLLGTPSVKSIHDYYPFAMEDGGRLAPMAPKLVDRLAILVVVRRFPGMGAADYRSLRSDSYVRMKHFVRRSTSVPFRRFLGDVRREFMQRLSATLHGTLFVTQKPARLSCIVAMQFQLCIGFPGATVQRTLSSSLTMANLIATV